ncbi:MAG TPA: hypothetical protein PKV16_03190 [Caldisericia bacterium]|nr:hypothetical protein [Caldisericia bacterium]HPF48316.1 hypothetical protein [Caldisericia bacterium]HPI83505.1 hypothetical protein [Caldisericia bacterium]HPQ92769.1 hypothetical protein [Caldisericia bacterium]HRV74133.1 hypothetical protein [Caldisericia bacterium]
MTRIRIYIAIIMALTVTAGLAACGNTDPLELTKAYDGSYFSFSYPETWNILERDKVIELTFEGTVVSFEASVDQNSKNGDFTSVNPTIEALLYGYTVQSKEEIEIGGSKFVEIETKDDKENTGILAITPFDGICYILKLPVGNYSVSDLETVKLVFKSFNPKVTTWADDSTPPSWTYETYDGTFWSMKYLSFWQIEKENSKVSFIIDDKRSIEVAFYAYAQSDPSNKESIAEIAELNCGVTPDNGTGVVAYQHKTPDTWLYYIACKGKMMRVAAVGIGSDDQSNINSEFEENIEASIASLTYNPDLDPDITVPDKIITDNGNNANNPDTNNNSSNSSDVKQGDNIDVASFSAILPSGWTFEEQSDMMFFVYPPDRESGSMIIINLQNGSLYNGMELSEFYDLFAESTSLGPMSNSTIDGHNAINFVADGKETNTIFMNNNYLYIIKYNMGIKDYKKEYEAFLQWFKAK